MLEKKSKLAHKQWSNAYDELNKVTERQKQMPQGYVLADVVQKDVDHWTKVKAERYMRWLTLGDEKARRARVVYEQQLKRDLLQQQQWLKVNEMMKKLHGDDAY